MALSMSRRRAAAPSFMRLRSSGENSTAVSVPASSVAVFFTELTVICLRTPFRMTMRTVCSRSWLTISANISARSQPKPISSRSKRVRKLLPAAKMYTASRRFVLPCAFSPYMTFVPGESSAVSKS